MQDPRFAERLKFHGAMEAVLVRANGDVEVTQKDNIIVTVGFDFVCDALANGGARPAALGWIGVGSGVTAPAVANTTLQTELTRAVAAYAHAAGTKVFTLTANFAAGVATGAITEAGVLNAAAAGILFDRVTFGVINKGAADTLAVTFSFTLS